MTDTTQATNRPALNSDADLARDYKHVVDAIDGLLKSGSDLPLVIEDDEDQSLIAALVPKLRGAIKRVEELHEGEKKPYLEAGRVVDRWFKGQRERAHDLRTKLQARLDAFAAKQVAAERARREAEEAAARAKAAKAAEEASRIAAEAEARREAERAAAEGDEGDGDSEPVVEDEEHHARQAAAEAENEAEEAAAAAAAKPAEMARTHTDAGNTVSATEEPVPTVINYGALVESSHVLWPYLSPAEMDMIVKRFVKATKGVRPLSGVKIEMKVKALVR